jgi:replication factor C subunit 2/4
MVKKKETLALQKSKEYLETDKTEQTGKKNKKEKKVKQKKGDDEGSQKDESYTSLIFNKSSMNEPLNIDDVFKGNDLIVVKKDSMTKKDKYIRQRSQTTWVDMYRPKTLNDIIGHDDVKNMLIASIEKGDLPHLLFYGGSGTGKTSTVMALVMQLYGPKRINEKVLELNASDENGINVVRDKIIKFANIVVGSADPKYPSPSFKIIILDEADSMTSEAQTALKKIMESTCAITRFVFICNYESKIIDPIKSRCADFRFNPIPDDLMISKLKFIAKQQNMNLEENVFKVITDICEGDARRSINTLQNIKYIPQSKTKLITIADIYNITSHVDKTYLDNYWNQITSGNVVMLHNIVVEITNTGYPMSYILQCIKDKIFDSNMTARQISDIVLHLGKVERMITCGSDNYIQLLAVLAYINSMCRKIPVQKPGIY